MRNADLHSLIDRLPEDVVRRVDQGVPVTLVVSRENGRLEMREIDPEQADRTARFQRDFDNLTPHQQRAVLGMVRLLVTGLREKRFAPQLRVKRVQRHEGLWEVTWAANSRATFTYGTEVRPGEPHIIWRRVGTHAIFREP